MVVSIRCSPASTAEHLQNVGPCGHSRFYSLLASEYRGIRTCASDKHASQFLFAARQRVQRNTTKYNDSHDVEGFYSLLASEYSGTSLRCADLTEAKFLFAARQRVQRNKKA